MHGIELEFGIIAKPLARRCQKTRKGVKTVFFQNYSTYEGEGARLYRSPVRIREDIIEIKNRIKSVDAMLNIRDMLTAMIESYADDEPETWIPVLSSLVEEAEDSLDRLKRLKDTLDILSEELEDVKCAMGI